MHLCPDYQLRAKEDKVGEEKNNDNKTGKEVMVYGVVGRIILDAPSCVLGGYEVGWQMGEKLGKRAERRSAGEGGGFPRTYQV